MQSNKYNQESFQVFIKRQFKKMNSQSRGSRGREILSFSPYYESSLMLNSMPPVYKQVLSQIFEPKGLVTTETETTKQNILS